MVNEAFWLSKVLWEMYESDSSCADGELTIPLEGTNKTRKVLDVDTQFKSPDLVDAFLFWYNGI